MLEYVNTKYPDQWTHVYTDGSAAEATRDGGGGVCIRYNGGKAHIIIATGKYSTNFKAAAEALKKATNEIRDNILQTKPDVVIFTDVLSVLNELQNPRQKDLNEVETALVDLAAQTNLALQWIPTHCGIKGNELADRLAQEGGHLGQEDRYTSYTYENTIIKPLTTKRWKQQHPNSNQSDSFHKLNRPEQAILFRLRTGHNRLNAHMCSKFKVGESEMCRCNADIMAAEHLLQHCQLHGALRQDIWPEPKPLRDKLCGNLEELRRTAAFVRAIDTSVQRSRKKTFRILCVRLEQRFCLVFIASAYVTSSEYCVCGWNRDFAWSSLLLPMSLVQNIVCAAGTEILPGLHCFCLCH